MGFALSNTRKAAVATIVHPLGVKYSFVEDDMREWSWWEMVAQLDDESLRYVVQDGDRIRGLVGCEFRQRTGSYDHRRQVQQPDIQAQFRCWDFIRTRSDGAAVRLHTEWSDLNIPTFAADGARGNPDPSQRLGEV